MKKLLSCLFIMLCLCTTLLFVACDEKDGGDPVCEHTWSEWETSKEASCKAGEEKRICIDCEESEVRTVEPTEGHTFGAWQTTAIATCTTEGKHTRTCTVCGQSESETVAAQGDHQFDAHSCTSCGMAVTAGLAYTDLGTSYAVSGMGDVTDTHIVVPAIYEGKPVRKIAAGAFAGESIQSVTLPTSVVMIEAGAFEGCEALATLSLPSTLAIVGDRAFANCISLPAISVPIGTVAFGDGAFAGCEALRAVSVSSLTVWCRTVFEDFDSNPLSNGADFYLNGTRLSTLEVPSNIASLSAYCFYGCTSLERVWLHAYVDSIGTGALSHCANLVSLEAEGGMVEKKVDGIMQTVPATYISIGNCIITSKSSALTVGCKTSEIPADGAVLSISGYAFFNCIGLESVVVPEGVVSVSASAFISCYDLVSVTLPDTVTAIGSGAFADCTALHTLTVPFVGNSATVSQYSSNSLFGYIFGTTAYEGYSAVEQVFQKNEEGDIDNKTFYIPDSLRVVTVTGGEIYYGAFSGCASLVEITLPKTATVVGFQSLYGCSSLEKLTLPFAGHSATATFNTHFGYAFGATSYFENEGFVPATLQSVTLCSNADVAAWAFYHCGNLQSVTLAGKTPHIGEGAFSGCGSLLEITLPAQLESIGTQAFGGCGRLAAVSAAGGATWQVSALGDFSDGVAVTPESAEGLALWLRGEYSNFSWRRSA